MSRILIATLALALLFAAQPAQSKLLDQCGSSASTSGGVLMVCPHGDGPTLESIGAMVDVTLMINNGGTLEPYPSCCMLPQDIWIAPVGDYGYSSLCYGANSCNADGMLDENGHTTISGTIAAGGYSEDPVYVVAIGQTVGLGEGCDNPIPLVLVSPDINGDMSVDMLDFMAFADAIRSGGYDPHMDYNGDNLLNVGDFAMFANHYRHTCE